MKLGVCYYPEAWPVDRWALDARMMRDAGLSIVRIAEFAWANMEPAEGRFTWEWLDRAIQTLAGEGLKIVLGTPTAAPPAWLVHADPDVLPVDEQGRRRRFGSRRHYCPNSPSYRGHTHRIVAAMAERYAPHPEVIGWQIDNEYGCHHTARCYCPSCVRAFREWLKARYQTLEALNEAWGAAFWSQTYSDWDQIEPPALTIAEANPSHILDYYRFSSDSWLAYQQLQLELLRQAISQAGADDRQFVTTNFMGTFPDLDYHAIARPLDLVVWDSYPTRSTETQSARLYSPHEAGLPPAHSYDLGDPAVTGFSHDLTRGLKRAPFWVMEQQCGYINNSLFNTGVRAGAVRLWTWHALACGASAVVYFRWRASRFAQEQYHSGLLYQDGSPATGYTDLVEMRPELDLMAQVAAEPIGAQVALLLSYQDLWALEIQPHGRDFEYLRHLFVYYRALQQMGIPTDIVPPETDLSDYKIVISPTAHLADEHLAMRFRDYAAAGGTLLLGVRSGFKTPTNLITDQPLPGVFSQLIGARLTGWHALPTGIEFALESQIPGLEGPASSWIEGLLPSSPPDQAPENALCKTLVRYAEGPFASHAALVENPVGKGHALYLGWYPTYRQAAALVAYLADRAGIQRHSELSAGVVVARRGAYTILLNFTDADFETQVDGKPVTVRRRGVIIVRKQLAASGV